jgi:hypothetical protein
VVGAQIIFSSFFLSMLAVQVADLKADSGEPDARRQAS